MTIEDIKIEDMACCGNCLTRGGYYNEEGDFVENCSSWNGFSENEKSSGLCNFWQFDGLTQIKRMY